MQVCLRECNCFLEGGIQWLRLTCIGPKRPDARFQSVQLDIQRTTLICTRCALTSNVVCKLLVQYSHFIEDAYA